MTTDVSTVRVFESAISIVATAAPRHAMHFAQPA